MSDRFLNQLPDVLRNLSADIGDNFDAGSADASADPWIYIDPTFASGSQYRIAGSDGVANGVSAVPEPSTFALLALGLDAAYITQVAR